MAYCTSTDIERVMAQSLTSATSSTDSFDTLGDLINIGNVFDKNTVTDDVINTYIRIADQEIDAALSELYKTPLKEVANFEGILYSETNEYNEYIVLSEAAPLSIGDIVLITGENITERHEINELIDYDTFATINEIQYSFPADSRVIRVTYPEPIRYISARKAAANIYDKYFSAEVSPSTSKYGEFLRDLASRDIDSILNGRIILHGQHRIGRRFFNANLADQYALPSGGEISRDMRQIK